MYPEALNLWRRGQALTADRLNKTVAAVNYLLSLAANSDADQPSGGATNITVAPPGGYTPPEPSFQNPPANDVTALGQPFQFPGEEVKIIPPPAYGADGSSAAMTDGTPFYSVVSTDKFGRIRAVSVSASAPSAQLWDGENPGQIVAYSGLLKKNEFGEDISVDTNSIAVPVAPVFVPSRIGEISLIGSPIGNSVPVAGLLAGSGISLSRKGGNAAFVIEISATGGLSSVNWSDSITEPTISSGTLTLNLADSNNPGGIKNIEFDLDSTSLSISGGIILLPPANYDPSDPSVEENPGFIKTVSVTTFDATDPSFQTSLPTASISRGDLKIQLPKTPALSIENVTDNYGTTANPGVDGWTQTLYIPGLQSGTLDYVYIFRQLMRFSGQTLQIVNQQSTDGSTWSPA